MGIGGRGRADSEPGWLALALILALMAFLAGALHQPAAAAETSAIATGARIGGDSVRTRFVADLSKPVSYSVYVLPDPYRVLIDLPDVIFELPPGIGEKTRGLISEYRYGQVSKGRARIVIDTDGPVLIEKSFIVDPRSGQPARIVVDLVKTTEEAFLKTYKAEEGNSEAAVDQAAAGDAATEAAAAPDAAEPEPAPAPLAKRQPSGRKVVVIDPGHGGIDPGAIGLHRTKEKDVVFAVAQALRGILRDNGSYDVVMTRDSDKFITLKDRVKIARDSGADLFIAIHADTVRGPEARGATIYTLSDRASDAEAEALAQKENRADIINGIDLGGESQEVADILIDLAQRESKNHSVVFARKAVGEMQQVTGFTGKPLRSAGFVVLKAPDVPSVLVELGYLSTKADEAQLTSPQWQARVARALAGAVDKYFATEVAARSN
jgi:N-acetylmuramoyl-L-alanine amidase